jgi:predicted dehydrogenase
MASALSPYKVTVWGTCGTINFKGNIGNGQFELRYFDPSQLPDKQLNESLASEGRLYPYDPIEFTEEVIPLDNSLGINIFSDFARAVRTDTSPIIPPEETVAVMETLDRCRENSAGIEDMRL